MCCNWVPYICRRNSILVIMLVCCNQKLTFDERDRNSSHGIRTGVATIPSLQRMRASPALNNYITLYMILSVVWLSARITFLDRRSFIDNIIHYSSGARLSLFQIAPRGQTSRDLENGLVMCSVDVEWRDFRPWASYIPPPQGNLRDICVYVAYAIQSWNPVVCHLAITAKVKKQMTFKIGQF
jgi:hypothetical protein